MKQGGVLGISYGWQSIWEGNSNKCLLPPFFRSLAEGLTQTLPACVFDGEPNIFPAWCTDAEKRGAKAWSSHAKISKKESGEYPEDAA